MPDDISSNVHQLAVKSVPTEPLPHRIIRPCEYGLMGAVRSMETQMGTVEAYNRLCIAAAALKEKIDNGEAHQQHVTWATDPKYIYPPDLVPKVKKTRKQSPKKP